MSLRQTVCTTPMCKDGRAAVARMDWTFQYLVVQYPNFNKTAYSATVESIKASLAAIDSWYADLIPFNPNCCTMADLGAQADNITNQMLGSVGAVNIPPPPPSTNWASLIVFGGVALLLIAYQPQVSRLFKK